MTTISELLNDPIIHNLADVVILLGDDLDSWSTIDRYYYSYIGQGGTVEVFVKSDVADAIRIVLREGY